MQSLRLDQITLDPDLQSRAEIDQDACRDYAEALANGAQFSRISVFFDGATYWLADGFHRWHAHKSQGVEEIAATVRTGSKQDALRFSLSANAQHGKQRGPGDYRKAYGIACRHDLVKPIDTEGVRDLLQCSIRWARDLTKDAREQADRKRDEAIRAERAKGSTQRQVAEKVGVSKSQVAKADIAHKRQSSVCGQTPVRERPSVASATSVVKRQVVAPPPADPPPEPMFNPEGFMAAAAEFHDPGSNLWGAFIVGADRFAKHADPVTLRENPWPKMRDEALVRARHLVATLGIIITDLEHADAHAA